MTRETIYLAGKITGDPNYREKFTAAAQELEAAGHIVVNPAMLPENAFSWEAYMRMSMAMLDECTSVCFLPDWKDSRGATWEYGRALATGKRIFMYTARKSERSNKTPKYIVSDVKTETIAFRCLVCGKISAYPEKSADGRNCAHCGSGCINPIGYAKAVKLDAK